MPDNLISLSGDPLAVTPDGKTVIVSTRGEWDNGFATCMIRFLDLATGKETQSALMLKERKNMIDPAPKPCWYLMGGLVMRNFVLWSSVVLLRDGWHCLQQGAETIGGGQGTKRSWC